MRHLDLSTNGRNTILQMISVIVICSEVYVNSIIA